METQFLCGGVDDWQRNRIRMLEDNTVRFPDVVWKVEGGLFPDCRQMYADYGFFQLLFDSPLTSSLDLHNDTVVYPLDEKAYIFHMIRVFCHTGLVLYNKGENILRTLERYAAFKFYGIDQGKSVFRTLIQNTLTPVNAVQALEYAIHRDDADVLGDIEKYFCQYAFVIMRQRGFASIKRESMSNLVGLCSSNDLNISEADLLSHVYKLCERKVGDREYQEFPDAMSILRHEFGVAGSLWGAVRLDRLTMNEFMEFTQKKPKAMSNDQIVECMTTIFSLTSRAISPQQPKKRKTFVAVSSYPRNLKVVLSPTPQVDITRWERGKLQVFFVFPFSSSEIIQLPPVVAGHKRINCAVRHSDKCLGLYGRIHSGVIDAVNEGLVNITVSIVNFRHDRWKKARESLNLAKTSTFDIPNILSWNAIEGSSGTPSGYTFDLGKYPEY
ncbi:unnamed protein product, partial [Ectocarpus sp. 6 AP-2014]